MRVEIGLTAACLVVLGAAVTWHVDWIAGLGAMAAAWVLMPWEPRS